MKFSRGLVTEFLRSEESFPSVRASGQSRKREWSICHSEGRVTARIQSAGRVRHARAVMMSGIFVKQAQMIQINRGERYVGAAGKRTMKRREQRYQRVRTTLEALLRVHIGSRQDVDALHGTPDHALDRDRDVERVIGIDTTGEVITAGINVSDVAKDISAFEAEK